VADKINQINDANLNAGRQGVNLAVAINLEVFA